MIRLLDPCTCLPHREPALILESVRVVREEEIESRFTVRPGSHYVEDDHLCLAGLIEAMAQAAAAHLGLDREENPGGAPGLLVGLEDLRVTRLPGTGERVQVRCEVTEHFGPSLWVRAETRVEDESIARGILKVFAPEPDRETG
jgi:3-hydroxymyristoyl/3-hydroxydecanoyl-(acyl carrier protein) dehydratase